jgi:hypothetical protein
MPDYVDLLSGRSVRADLACVLCARVVATAHGSNDEDLTPASIRVLDPDHTDAVRRLRCPYCSGRLWLQDAEDFYGEPRQLTHEDLHPPRGRRGVRTRAS